MPFLLIPSPVIIVSALSGTSQIVEGLDLGAVDYIKKLFEWEKYAYYSEKSLQAKAPESV
ncbi:hypothetical protein [Dyadobacter frigoris]|uniref:hypothetical protein n=1 Tax=Dyadobacter frigoris TaxID=2576211 RepID=UPI0015F2C8D9|nr:hypothetical protein [Dyadobacter frigoris]GLU56051.1 hypothetical protein Dfri01_55120 [Dyadobacter frigoris]